MSEADQKVARLLKVKFAEENPSSHLATCPDVVVKQPDGYNGSYGCDTGCDYARIEGTLTCPHGYEQEYEYGDFGDLESLFDELDAS